jgi:hypothetical protein
VLLFNQQELEHRMVFLEQISNATPSDFGGVGGAGTYDVNTAGQAFTFSESFQCC